MGVFAGIEPTWALQTNAGRTHIATKGTVQSGLVLNLDSGVSSSYPGSGTTWTDLSGRGNTGTLTNGPTYSSDNRGSLSFDGTNDYVDCGNSSSANLSSAFSLSAWFLVSSSAPNTNDSKGIIAKYTAVTANRSYMISFNGFLNEVQFTVSSDGTSTESAIKTISYSIVRNIWYNIVAVFTPSVKMEIYANGILGFSDTTTLSQVFSSSTQPLLIGGQASGTNPFTFSGKIAQVLVYDRALTTTEIRQNNLAHKSRFINIINAPILTLDSESIQPITDLNLITSPGVLRIISQEGFDVTLTFSSTVGGSVSFNKTVLNASGIVQGIVLTTIETNQLNGTGDPTGIYSVTVNASISDPTNGSIISATPLTFSYTPDPVGIIGQLSVIVPDGGNGNETGPTPSIFRISRTGSTAAPVTVTYIFTGSATAGVDYTLPAGYNTSTNLGSVTIPAGQSVVDVNVPTIDNATVDGLRNIRLNLETTGGYTITTIPYATATLINNDGVFVPILSSPNISVSEGDGTSKSVTIFLRLNQATTVPVSFAYAFRGGSAILGTDFDSGGSVSGRLTINTMATLTNLTALIYGDTTVEENKTFFIDLSDPSGLTFQGGEAVLTITCTIYNDDPNQPVTITSDGTILGTILNDVLTGSSGVDRIESFEGDDLLTGGLGGDIILSTAGADQFIYNSFSESCLAFGVDSTDAEFVNGDRIKLPILPTALWNVGLITAVSLAAALAIAKSDKDLLTADSQPLLPGEAVMFIWGSGTDTRARRTYLAVPSDTGDITQDFLILTPNRTFTIGSLNVQNFFII